MSINPTAINANNDNTNVDIANADNTSTKSTPRIQLIHTCKYV